MAKKNRQKSKANKEARILASITNSSQKNISDKVSKPILKRLKFYYLLIFAPIILFISNFNDIVQFFTSIKESSKSPKDIVYERRFIDGIFSPFNVGDSIDIYLSNNGGGYFLVRDSRNSFQFKDAILFGCYSDKSPIPDFPINLKMKVHGNHMYLSSIFRDFKSNQIIGELIDNEWKIDYLNTLNYHSDEKSFELIDNQGNVNFQLWIDDKGKLNIRGYFVGKYCTYFLTDDGQQAVMHGEPEMIDVYNEYTLNVKPRFVKSLIPR